MLGDAISKAVKFAQAKKAGKKPQSSNPVARAVQQTQSKITAQPVKTPAQVTAEDIAQEKQMAVAASQPAPQPVQPIEAQPVEPIVPQEPIQAQMPNPVVNQMQNQLQTITPKARQVARSFRPSRRFRMLNSLFEKRNRF